MSLHVCVDGGCDGVLTQMFLQPTSFSNYFKTEKFRKMMLQMLPKNAESNSAISRGMIHMGK